MLLKDYKLLKEIGRGATAKVYQAQELSDPARVVSLKVFHASLFQDSEMSMRIFREAELSQSLNHPNIVRVQKVLENEESPVLVMDYVEGENLETFRQRLPFIFPEISLLIAIPILKALEYAHENKIVHRDLKPENILISTQGDILLTDFGLAKNLNSTTLTQINQIVGSIDYMSPEQTLGEKVTAASDLFSLSSILYLLLTGLKPFRRMSYLETLKAIREFKPQSIRQLNPKVPEALERLVFLGLEKDASLRIQSAKEYRLKLEEYLDLLGLKSPAFCLKSFLADPQFVSNQLESTSSFLEGQIASADKSGKNYLLSQLKLKNPYHSLSAKPKSQWKPAYLLVLGIIPVSYFLFSPPQKPVTVLPVEAKVPIPMAIEMTKETGVVRFEVDSDVEVFWDGKLVDANKPLVSEQGKHDLILKKKGFSPIRSQVKITGKKETVIKAKGNS